MLKSFAESDRGIRFFAEPRENRAFYKKFIYPMLRASPPFPPPSPAPHLSSADPAFQATFHSISSLVPSHTVLLSVPVSVLRILVYLLKVRHVPSKSTMTPNGISCTGSHQRVLLIPGLYGNLSAMNDSAVGSYDSR